LEVGYIDDENDSTLRRRAELEYRENPNAIHEEMEQKGIDGDPIDYLVGEMRELTTLNDRHRTLNLRSIHPALDAALDLAAAWGSAFNSKTDPNADPSEKVGNFLKAAGANIATEGASVIPGDLVKVAKELQSMDQGDTRTDEEKELLPERSKLDAARRALLKAFLPQNIVNFITIPMFANEDSGKLNQWAGMLWTNTDRNQFKYKRNIFGSKQERKGDLGGWSKLGLLVGQNYGPTRAENLLQMFSFDPFVENAKQISGPFNGVDTTQWRPSGNISKEDIKKAKKLGLMDEDGNWQVNNAYEAFIVLRGPLLLKQMQKILDTPEMQDYENELRRQEALHDENSEDFDEAAWRGAIEGGHNLLNEAFKMANEQSQLEMLEWFGKVFETDDGVPLDKAIMEYKDRLDAQRKVQALPGQHREQGLDLLEGK
jgi:hypothetical protein